MHEKRFVSTDAIIEKDGKILLTVRSIEPFEGGLCLPGGHLEPNETLEECIVREVKEETSIDIEPVEILGVYSDPERDPRGPTTTTVFLCKYLSGEPKGGDDAGSADFYNIEDVAGKLTFDHEKILDHYLRWKKMGGTYWSSK